MGECGMGKGGAISDQGCMKFIVGCYSNSPMIKFDNHSVARFLMLTVTESNIDAGLE